MKLQARLLVILCLILVSSACAVSLPAQTEANYADAKSAIAQLEDATKIELKKKVMTIGDEWTVSVNGKVVAEIKGIDIPALGDTYSILSTSGGFMGGEDEDIINVSPTANFYDQDEKPTGQLKKKILSLMATYTLKDTEGDTVAKLEQKFSLGFKANIKDGKGKDAWTVSRKVLSMGASITLERKKGTEVSAMDAIRMVVVANEIYEAENK